MCTLKLLGASLFIWSIAATTISFVATSKGSYSAYLWRGRFPICQSIRLGFDGGKRTGRLTSDMKKLITFTLDYNVNYFYVESHELHVELHFTSLHFTLLHLSNLGFIYTRHTMRVHDDVDGPKSHACDEWAHWVIIGVILLSPLSHPPVRASRSDTARDLSWRPIATSFRVHASGSRLICSVRLITEFQDLGICQPQLSE